ncbi:hypothetical protein [Tunicatimonas pelagia]|uniref:hypothetical protein n=1 Tax=Tunicatimonas pelagia TaxID=931531 RepID=UPI0026659529|nr:hypothetical protein [Tunicatimonas pelagia]WKN42177.1 hypothetical protein P0M28_24375 [Tunicatimonas pelagia]
MNFLKKKTTLLTLPAVALIAIACDANQATVTESETTVISIDTVEAEVTYDVNRKVVESVDTVGATTEYEIEKTIVKRTVEVDTITKEIEREQKQEFAQGNYKVIEEEVKTEQRSEEVETDN